MTVCVQHEDCEKEKDREGKRIRGLAITLTICISSEKCFEGSKKIPYPSSSCAVVFMYFNKRFIRSELPLLLSLLLEV